MFAVDTAIDAVQNGKKHLVNTFVVNSTVRDALNSFVDAQTEYTKQAVKVSTDTAYKLNGEFLRSVQDLSKLDYKKMMEPFGKIFESVK